MTGTDGKPGPDRNAIHFSPQDRTIPNRYVPDRSTPLVPRSGQAGPEEDVEMIAEIQGKLTHYPPSASPWNCQTLVMMWKMLTMEVEKCLL